MIVKTINKKTVSLEHNGYAFDVEVRSEDGRIHFTPVKGWGSLELHTQQPSETLLEAIDEAVYNANPEFWIAEGI